MRSTFLAVAYLLLMTPSCWAWHTQGHRIATEAAVEALPASVPRFFRDAAETIAHSSIDPDLAKARGFPELLAEEFPEHYLDVELLGGRPFPPTRYDLIQLATWLGSEPGAEGEEFGPAQTGTLPYSIVEGAQRLTMAFAEHRRWPHNPDIQAKALVYAGLLAHYAEDLCSPLHTTIHHNGRANPDGSSPHTGFHHQVDVLFERGGFDRAEAVEGLELDVYDKFMPAVSREFDDSHALVDTVYDLEPLLPEIEDGESRLAPAVRVFTAQRYRAAVRFTARLFLTAWEKSAEVELPDWLIRDSR
ncbi:MAG: hypothetical protein WBH75_06055 [Thermoanaerobaculia bacterium]